MCRLALGNGKVLDYLGQEELTKMFVALTKAMGGSGIGASVLLPSGNVYTKKGVGITEAGLAEWIMKKRRYGAVNFIYHTRMATHGSRCDENCHPFTHGGITMAHNGVAGDFGGLGDNSDSEAVTKILALGYSLNWLENITGVWVGFKGGRPFVVKGQASSGLHLLSAYEGKAWLFVSQVTEGLRGLFDSHQDLDCYTFIEGKERHERYSFRTYTTTYATPKKTTWTDTGTYGYKRYDRGEQEGTATTTETGTAGTIPTVKPLGGFPVITYANGIKTTTYPNGMISTQPALNPHHAGQLSSVEILEEHKDGKLLVKHVWTNGDTKDVVLNPETYNQLLKLTDPDFWRIKQAVKDVLDDNTYTEVELETFASEELLDSQEATSGAVTLVDFANEKYGESLDDEEVERLVVQTRSNSGQLGYKEVSWNEYDKIKDLPVSGLLVGVDGLEHNDKTLVAL